MIMEFIDPYTGETLQKDSEGNLYYKKGDSITIYKNYDGCYDFACYDEELKEERAYHDKEYMKKEAGMLTENEVRSQWYDEMNPWRLTFLGSLGDLANKNILLVGNGDKTREIYFAMVGGNVIFTDLSIEAVRKTKKQVERSKLREKGIGSIEFHAVDALHLPFPNDSFDIIYGAAFVHHLENINQFMGEVYRCLKTDGICRFMDQAHSPVWETLKKSILWPLKKYSYWRNPRSPGDLRADRRGGYTEECINLLMKTHGFKEMYFKREWFFFRVVIRHYGKWYGYDRKAMTRANSLFLFFKWIDSSIMNTKFMAKNGLLLTWGFTK